MTPTERIAIDIKGAYHYECCSKRQSRKHQKTLTAIRIPLKDRSEAIATRHHSDPGQYRICGHEVDSVEGEDILLVQNVPNPRGAPEALGRDRVE
jgi:hypothetical protein